jgi:hypothetical protein
MDLSFHADYGTTEFPGVGIEYDERGAGVGMNWRFTRTVAVSAGWDRLAARGDTGLGEDTRDFNENRFTVNLNWTPVR